MMAQTKLLPALRKIKYKGKTTLKLLKELRESGMDIPGKLTVERIRAAVQKLEDKEEQASCSSAESKKSIKRVINNKQKKTNNQEKDFPAKKAKKASGKREDGVKVKKQKLPKKKPFKHNEITFGKITTPGYECFSNMFPTAIYCLVNGEYIMFYSVEQAFQYMKTDSKSHREKIGNCVKAKDARYHGSARASCPMKENWGDIKEDIMFEILKAKYTQNVVMGEKLMETEDVPIVEIAPWDKEGFWGVDDDRQGQNKTGKLHERVRKWLRKRKGNKETVGYYSAELED